MEDEAQTRKPQKFSPVLATVIVLIFAGIFGGLALIISNSNSTMVDNGASDVTLNTNTSSQYQLDDIETQVVDTDQTMQNEEVAELIIEDITVGDGVAAKAGDNIVVHYTGTLLNGTKFDSSVDRGTPFTFELGAGSVIEGWDQGLLGMQVGGTRKLTIPSAMAYGDFSPSPLIPAGSVLVFEVELLQIN